MIDVATKDSIDDILRGLSGDFLLGLIVATHRIGPYCLHEYHPHKTSGCHLLDAVDFATTKFIGYLVVGDAVQSTNHRFGSLDAALAGMIAYRHEGANHHADRYFIAALERMEQE